MKRGANRLHITTFENRSGPLDGMRSYTTNETPGTGGIYSAIIAAEARGEQNFFTIQPSGSWASWASGAQDAYVASVAVWAKNNLRPGGIDVHHEADNDYTGTPPTGYAPSDYVAGATRLNDILRANLASEPGWEIWSCFIANNFKPGGVDIDQWYVSNVDGVACDGYNWKGTNSQSPPLAWATTSNDSSPATVFSAAANYVAAKGKKFGVFEVGCARRDPASFPNDETLRTSWIGSCMTYLASVNCQWAFYFDNEDADGSYPNWRISTPNAAGYDGTASVDAFMAGAALPPPSPPTPRQFDMAGWMAVA